MSVNEPEILDKLIAACLQILTELALKVRLLDITGDGVDIPEKVSFGTGQSVVPHQSPQLNGPQLLEVSTFGSPSKRLASGIYPAQCIPHAHEMMHHSSSIPSSPSSPLPPSSLSQLPRIQILHTRVQIHLVFPSPYRPCLLSVPAY